MNEPIQITEQSWDVDAQPLVSVSCRTYNHEKLIRDAIEGILMQKTTFPIELIIHDDASTDSTADIIRDYESKYPHIIKPIYQEENQYSKGVKIGMKYIHPKLKGKYYAICEGDDYWIDPYKLQKQINLLEEHGNSHVLSFHPVRLKVQNELGSNSIMGHFGNKLKIIGPFQIISNYIPTVSAVIRTDIFENYPNTSNKAPFGDAFLWAVAASKGYAIYIPESMAVRRKHNQGVYSSLNVKSQIEKSIKTRELMVNSKELSSIHNYIKAYLISLYQKHLCELRGASQKTPIIKKIISLIISTPTTLIWYLKIPLQKQLRRVKRYTEKIRYSFTANGN